MLPSEPSAAKVQKAALMVFFSVYEFHPSDINHYCPLILGKKLVGLSGLLKIYYHPIFVLKRISDLKSGFSFFSFSDPRLSNFLAHLSYLNKSYKHYFIALSCLKRL